MKAPQLIFFALLILVGAFVFMQSRPQLEPACQDAREAMRQLVSNSGGLASIVATVPEEALTRALNERFSGMKAEQCTALTPQLTAGNEALAHTAWASKMQSASEEVASVSKECHDKRVFGEIKSHAESAQCSNPKIIDAYKQAGYPYADLVTSFTDKRMALAQQLDKSGQDGTEDPLKFARMALDIADKERERNTTMQNTTSPPKP